MNKLTSKELKYIGVPLEYSGKDLSDYGEKGKLYKKYLQKDLKETLFPGKVLKVADYDMFNMITLTLAQKIISKGYINPVRIIQAYDIREFLGNKIDSIVTNEQEGLGQHRLIAVQDFDSSTDDFEEYKGMFQSFLRKWLISGRSVLILSEKKFLESNYDNWFKNLLKNKSVKVNK